jgi:hypothetical protein
MLKDKKEIQSMLDRLHEALIAVANHNVNFLSYEGQVIWNELAKQKGRREVLE